MKERLGEAGRPVTPGALYTTLRRLERKGLLASRLGAGSTRTRPRRYFRVTEAGWAAVRAARRLREALWGALPTRVDAVPYETGGSGPA